MIQPITKTKLNLRPIFVEMSHLYVYEGPCRFGQGDELTPEFDQSLNAEMYKGFLEDIRNNIPDWVNLLEPVYVVRHDDWLIPDEMIEAMAKGYEETVSRILCRRQTDASADWKAFGESLSGQAIPDFDESGYREEYLSADAGGKDGTVLGRYILAALAQKSMVTNKIARSKNPLAGISVEYDGKKLPGIRDYLKPIRISERGKNDKVAKNP